jgi:uncharacterized protein (TIGR03086 family)
VVGGVWLLESAVSYLIAAAGRATAPLLAAPTPCPAWDLELLLRHAADSMDVLSEAMTAGAIGVWPRRDAALSPDDPVTALRCCAAGLLVACADAGCAEHAVIIGDRELPASMTAVAGALEIAVHGWDIAAACGSGEPLPPVLAAILLPVAPVLITPASRPGLFADPVPLAGPWTPGDQLLAFTGRRPRLHRC